MTIYNWFFHYLIYFNVRNVQKPNKTRNNLDGSQQFPEPTMQMNKVFFFYFEYVKFESPQSHSSIICVICIFNWRCNQQQAMYGNRLHIQPSSTSLLTCEFVYIHTNSKNKIIPMRVKNYGERFETFFVAFNIIWYLCERYSFPQTHC